VNTVLHVLAVVGIGIGVFALAALFIASLLVCGWVYLVGGMACAVVGMVGLMGTEVIDGGHPAWLGWLALGGCVSALFGAVGIDDDGI
jgi:hypothetical protein